MRLELPFPPSVNHYWRTFRGRMLISEAGRAYRVNVQAAMLSQRAPRLEGRLSVHVELHPPDKRRRDIDNSMKGLLDAMAHGGAYVDDSQIDRLTIYRCNPVPGGQAVVTIVEI